MSVNTVAHLLLMNIIRAEFEARDLIILDCLQNMQTVFFLLFFWSRSD